MATKRLGGRERRHLRNRKKIRGEATRPRLVVFRSNKHMYAQLVDDVAGKTLMGVQGSSKAVADRVKNDKEEFAESRAIGEEIARKAVEKGIEKVVFDRAGYQYHGRVKALADAARKAGLKF
ncbi:MAG: 50S ribosomal protein L18 [bacterium]|jgi:large subunit ribosomal protein L18